MLLGDLMIVFHGRFGFMPDAGRLGEAAIVGCRCSTQSVRVNPILLGLD